MKKAGKIIILIIAVLLIAGVGGSYILIKKGKKPSYEFIAVEKQSIVQEVSLTGKVKPAEAVDLAFEKNGQVAYIYVSVGDQVKAGQTLATLNKAEFLAEMAQAQSNTESAKAQLQQYQAVLETKNAELKELKRGARPEEIQVAETKVSNAQKALIDAETNLQNASTTAQAKLSQAEQTKADAEVHLNNIKDKADVDLANIYDNVADVLNDAYVKAENAVNGKTDAMFSDDLSASPQLTFSTTDTQVKSDAEWQRIVAGNTLTTLKIEIDSLTSNNYNLLDKALLNGETHLKTIREFLTQVNDVLNAATGLSQTTIDTYKSNVNTGLTNVNTAIANINEQKQDIAAQKQTNQNNIDTAQQTFNEAETALTSQKAVNQDNIAAARTQVNDVENALTLAQDELALKKAGATEEQITAREAQVRQAEANLASQQAEIKKAQANVQTAQAKIAKTVIRAPINGVVTQQKAKIGEIVSANTILVSLISEKEFEVQANVPEVDIAKVKLDNPAKITLDAYGPEILFEAKVITIDPAETMLEGVATYQITLQFTEEDERIKSGMTANIDIVTAQKDDTIAIPYRAVTAKDGEKTVKVLKNNNRIEEIKVKTGLRGSDGNIEIIEGINEGDKVIIFMEE